MHWGDDFIFSFPDDRANDLEQLMREVFKVKVCKRVGSGFLTAVEFLHRKVAWNAAGFSWTHDPKHILAMADEATRANEAERLCDSWFEISLRDSADNYDEQETQQCRLAQHCMLDKTDQRNMQRKKEQDSCFVPRHCEMYAPTFVQVLQRGTRAQLEFSTSGNAE